MNVTIINEYANGLSEKGNKAVCEFADFMETEFPEVMPQIRHDERCYCLVCNCIFFYALKGGFQVITAIR